MDGDGRAPALSWGRGYWIVVSIAISRNCKTLHTNICQQYIVKVAS